MITTVFFIIIIAFLIAWVVNVVVGVMMGERPRDTGSLWIDVLARIFMVFELGWIGRLLNSIGLNGFWGKVVLFIGLLCALIFLAPGCPETAREDSAVHGDETNN